MQELRPGLWTWTAAHPEWTEAEGGPEGWDRAVRSYAYDSGDCLVLFDPQSPPSLVEGLIEAQDVAVLLTMHWHARSAAECVTRFGATVHTARAGLEQTTSKIGGEATPYDPGDVLPGGVEARPTDYAEEAIFWIPAHGALVVGDTLLGTEGHGVRMQSEQWLAQGATLESVRESLKPLTELPVELLLLTHGDPVVDDAHGQLCAVLEG